MDRTCFINNLEQLCLVHGVSGHEQNVVNSIKSILKDYETLEIDAFGNISLLIKGAGKAPSIMFTAHSDEVGGIVNKIMPNGLLGFRLVGGVDPATLYAARVRVGNLQGTISCSSAHLRTEGSQFDMLIDVGAESKEDAILRGVSVGDPVTLDSTFTVLTENRICSRVIDDRVGCACIIEAIKYFDSIVPPGDVLFTISVREETSMTGAQMLANRLQPDCAITIDTAPINDIYANAPDLTIGRGPVIQLMDGVFSAFTGNATHPGMKSAIINAANKANIPIQLCAEVGSWVTDADRIHSAAYGIPTGYISIPRRYAHSASELLDIRDAEATVNLIIAVINNMEEINLSFI